MAKKTTEQSIFKKSINILSHPAWNGVSCFFTAIATLGLGGFALAFVLGLFSRIQDFVLWFLEPVTTSRYVVVGGSIILIAFIVTSFQQFLSSRNKFPLPHKTNKSAESKSKYLPVPVPPGIGNSYLKDRYISPPSGDVVLGGVQFQLKQDSLIFDTNEHIRYYLPLEYGGKQVDFQLPESVNRIKSVYFLINSGNSKIIYANKSIGKISLIFKQAPPIDVELVLGKNIREWCPGNSGDYIRETSNPETLTGVWIGMSKNGANAVIDCLKIPVYEFMKDCYLEKIIFEHRSIPQPPDTMGVHYLVFGISLEIQ
jgi:hypothetical protein